MDDFLPGTVLGIIYDHLKCEKYGVMTPEVELPLNGAPKVFKTPLERSLHMFLTFYSV